MFNCACVYRAEFYLFLIDQVKGGSTSSKGRTIFTSKHSKVKHHHLTHVDGGIIIHVTRKWEGEVDHVCGMLPLLP